MYILLELLLNYILQVIGGREARWSSLQSLPSLAGNPGVTNLHHIPSTPHHRGSGNVKNALCMVDPPDSEATAPPVVTSDVPRHLLAGEDSSLVITGADTARPPVGLGGAVGVGHPLEAPPLHDSLEAPLLSPTKHVNPLTDCEVRGC